jgi:hypothetical protein
MVVKASGGSTVVEHLITHYDIEGSNPGATDHSHCEEMEEK